MSFEILTSALEEKDLFNNQILDSEEEDEDASDSEDDSKQPRRRSKKVTEGRKFKCDRCDKTYLSYPALYTHYKLKHSSGEKPNLPSQTGRGRGRPRKNVSLYLEIEIS